MDFNESAVFVKVVQAGSFSEAARQVGLPTSTVSTRVARLEKRLGITLLQRTTRRLSLTEAGSVYYHHAAQGLSYLLEAETALDEARQQPQGKLKVTAPADIGDSLLANLIQKIQCELPALEIELFLTDRYIDLVAEGIDVAIRTGELRDSSLVAKSLGSIRWEIFANPDYLKDAAPLMIPQDIQAHDCLQFTPMGRNAWILESNDSRITIPLSARIMVNSVGVVKSMAENGKGIALLPTFLCRQSLTSGTLSRVLPDWHGQAHSVHMVYPKQRFMSPKLRAFLDLAQDELGPKFSH